MSQESRIEVINREGWRKEYPLQKGIIYIGSAPTNDIVLAGLHGVGVAPLHAQLIAGGNAGYKLVNLSDQEILLGAGGNEALPPRAVMNLPEGTTLRLGEFTLIFRGGAGVNYGGFNNGSGSANIGLRLSLPYTRLAPNQTLAGTATIRNLGGKTGARFDVILEGLDEDCFDIEPGPLLSSGAEKDISFRLYHHGARPLAGEWTFAIRATSSNAYPGEQAQVFQTIEVLPLYQHRLRLWPVKGVKVTTPPEKTTPLQNTLKPKEERARTRPQPEPEPVQEEWWATSEAGDESAPRPEVRRLKAQAAPPPPAVVTPVEVESETRPTPAAATDEAGEEWGWAVKAEPQPQPAPPVVVPPEPTPSVSRAVEPEPVPATHFPEAAEPPVFPPPMPEPEPEIFRPVEAEVAPVAAPPPVLPVEARPAPVEKQPPQPPEPPPPQAEPVEEPSQLNKWWNRLKGAVPFRSRAVEPAQPVVVSQPPSSEIEKPVTLQPAPPAGPLAEEPQETTVISEQAYLAPAEPEPQAEVAPPVTTYSEPAGEEIEPQVEEQSQAEVSPVEPVFQAPELPVEEPTPEPETPPPPEESKPAPQTTEFEDWWAEDIEPVPPAEVRPEAPPETPSLSEDQPEAESPAKSDEWWEAIEVKTRVKTEESPIIKLKANPSQIKQPETQAKTTEAEEWWAVDVEASPEQADKKS